MSDAKVWAVSSGSYSDYGVICCFTTMDTAITYAASRNNVPREVQARFTELVYTPYRDRTHEQRLELSELKSRIDKAAGYDESFVESFDLYEELPS